MPIDVVEITTPTLSVSASGGSVSKMFTSSSMSSSQQQQQASSSSSYFEATTSSSRSANETLIASERADTATGMTSSGPRKQVGFDTDSKTVTNATTSNSNSSSSRTHSSNRHSPRSRSYNSS